MIQKLDVIIREHPFFHGLEERHIKLIAGCAKNVRIAEGKMIFHEGDAANQFFLLREGQVAIEVHVPTRGNITIQTVHTGDVIGWSWLVEPHRWHFGARAQQATRALAFDGKCLRKKCESDHDLGYELFKRFTGLMVHRLEATILQLLDVYGPNA
jgi:CRP/FNR family transcriptional regulator, cyclic AMP receptor protein